MELRRAGARGSLLSASSSIDRSLAISCSNLVNGLFLVRYGRYSYFQRDERARGPRKDRGGLTTSLVHCASCKEYYSNMCSERFFTFHLLIGLSFFL